MKLKVDNKSDFSIDLDIFQKVNKVVALQEQISENQEVSLAITNSDKIQKLNKRFRGKDAKTDVLSFPSYIDFIPFLGDIIIDIEVANSQKGNNSLEEELQYLYLHGLLHLMGYDHMQKKDAIIMNDKEKKYLKEIGR
ncbi:MAG: rRNA maturation RNase YbeY [Candidatus Cloacimonadota bacterium]|nr:rRNA maturation RNase YbeY [Candidatus Cloacimonadota bacterium]